MDKLTSYGNHTSDHEDISIDIIKYIIPHSHTRGVDDSLIKTLGCECVVVSILTVIGHIETPSINVSIG